MSGKVAETNALYREMLTKDCELVITRKDWFVQFDAKTWDEEKDMMYKITSDKVPQFLSDLKKNLKLFNDMKEVGKPLSKDVEGARGMIIKFKRGKPGVYLSDSYWIASDEEDYRKVEDLMKKARDRASKVEETF